MRLSYIFPVAIIGLVTGFWMGCTVDLTADVDGKFECATEADCEENYECREGFCYRRSVANNIPGCIDNDNDGYGVGTLEERQKCSLCENLGLCDEDCDDNDNTRSPGAGEACNGRDDNCNETVDEPTTCEGAGDCEALRPYIPANTSVTCENQQCVVKMNTQFCPGGQDPCPCNANPVACELGAYTAVPDPSECL